ncbi:MAG: dockerin type I domain-containing protein [Microgenomates group bacterium]|jgi:hypothetical protein
MDSNLPETTIVSPALNQVVVPSAGNKKIFIIGGVVLALILIGLGGFLFVKMKPAQVPVSVTPTPTPAAATEGAKFFLVADPPVASVGAQIKVSVLVKTDKDAANLFIAKLKFPSQLLQAKSISLRSEATSSGFIKDWFISNWVENTIDNNTGSASLVGGVPNPGFQTSLESSGSAMADVMFIAKAAGDGVISFDDTSAVYRNSDNANILFGKQALNFKITGETVPSPSVTVTPTASPSVIPTLIPTPVSSPSTTPTGSLEGDVNKDSKLDLQDLSSLLSSWGTANIDADLNKDGRVNAFDYSRLTKLLKDSAIIQ